GMGPAGESVAGDLAEAGLDVIGIDKELVGGECPYWGCIPSKMMIRAADLLAEARRIPGMAGSVEVTPDWGPVATRIRDEATDNWDDTVAVERFEGKGGRFIRGHGRMVGPKTVEVEGQRITANKAVVISTGTSAAIPPISGLSETPFWTNREAIKTETLPSSLAVLGGGAIGAELAQAFARFDVKVTVIEALDRLVPLEEPEAGDLLRSVFAEEGIGVRVGVAATSVSHNGNEFTIDLADGDVLKAEKLLVATGRRVDLGAVGAMHLDVDESGRFLPVDENLRVADGVWAVGDVTGRGAFTHVGMYQAAIAVADILGRDHQAANYAALPRVTFTDPEIGAAGLTEQQARDAGIDVATTVVQVPHTARGWLHKAGNEGVIKLVADAKTGTLVGATAAGPSGGEVLGLLTLAVHAQVPLNQLRTMMWAYPTFHRGIEDALRDLKA
ncbi:MAG: NAD(P)/FAD-dependent oxidoreductase, partial [Acidimicrobiales bacterium]